MRWQNDRPTDAQLPASNQTLLKLLRCPVCKAVLSVRPTELVCPPCRRAYPIGLGTPDLRLDDDPLIPPQEVYRKDETIDADTKRLRFAGLLPYSSSQPP